MDYGIPAFTFSSVPKTIPGGWDFFLARHYVSDWANEAEVSNLMCDFCANVLCNTAEWYLSMDHSLSWTVRSSYMWLWWCTFCFTVAPPCVLLGSGSVPLCVLCIKFESFVDVRNLWILNAENNHLRASEFLCSCIVTRMVRTVMVKVGSFLLCACGNCHEFCLCAIIRNLQPPFPSWILVIFL